MGPSRCDLCLRRPADPACHRSALVGSDCRKHQPSAVSPLPCALQIQSNALAALEAIDDELAEQVLGNGCITGDRVNGLCDGVTGDWCGVSNLMFNCILQAAYDGKMRCRELPFAKRHPVSALRQLNKDGLC